MACSYDRGTICNRHKLVLLCRRKHGFESIKIKNESDGIAITKDAMPAGEEFEFLL